MKSCLLHLKVIIPSIFTIFSGFFILSPSTAVSVIPSLNRNVVYPMVVNFHENREDQDAISSILSKIDEKLQLIMR